MYNLAWNSEMYLKDVAEFLASKSSCDISCEDNNGDKR